MSPKCLSGVGFPGMHPEWNAFQPSENLRPLLPSCGQYSTHKASDTCLSLEEILAEDVWRNICLCNAWGFVQKPPFCSAVQLVIIIIIENHIYWVFYYIWIRELRYNPSLSVSTQLLIIILLFFFYFSCIVPLPSWSLYGSKLYLPNRFRYLQCVCARDV